MGRFAKVKVGKRMLIDNYSGILMYYNLYVNWDLQNCMEYESQSKFAFL